MLIYLQVYPSSFQTNKVSVSTLVSILLCCEPHAQYSIEINPFDFKSQHIPVAYLSYKFECLELSEALSAVEAPVECTTHFVFCALSCFFMPFYHIVHHSTAE